MDNKARSRFILTLVTIAGIMLSGVSGWFLYETEERSITIEFRKDVDERTTSLHREMEINFEVLRSLAILFRSNHLPDWQQFSSEAKRALSRHQNIKALEWIPQIIDSQRALYESNQQQFPDFEITERQQQGNMVTAEKRQEYYPVYYVEPINGNEAAIGFDLASNATRYETLKASRDSAMPLATASITLVQETGSQKGILAFLPIYRGIPTTTAKRRELLTGFVLGVYRIGDIFDSSALSEEPLGMELKLIDETVASAPSILHEHKSRTGSSAHASLSYRKEMPGMWGRQWVIVASPTSDYISARRTILPYIIFFAGIIFTTLITLYLRFNLIRAAVVQQLVFERTLELAEANQKLELLSRTDGLTSLANRRTMDEFLDKEWLRAIRNGSSISFILIDIDFFKLYNDNYGHTEGDKCLKMVASRLSGAVRRPGDLAARYGGEEFAIVLAETAEAEHVAKACLQSIQDLKMPHRFSDATDIVTISIGLCTMKPEKGMHPELIINIADKALYKAKQAGRNRLEIIDQLSQPEHPLLS